MSKMSELPLVSGEGRETDELLVVRDGAARRILGGAYLRPSWDHIGDICNPHKVTAEQIGAVTLEEVEAEFAKTGGVIQIVTRGMPGYSITSTIPQDNTRPSKNEGTHIVSVVFTPKLATSDILVSLCTNRFSLYKNGGIPVATLALFVGDATDAVQSAYICGSPEDTFAGFGSLSIGFKPIASTGATIVLSLRIGCASSGSEIKMGPFDDYLGGSNYSFVKIEEVA